MVAGLAAAKKKLYDAARAIRAGKTDVVPMGYVICGPVGTGKTFLTTCFAGEIGIPAVTLKNFRSMCQAVTEGNLDSATLAEGDLRFALDFIPPAYPTASQLTTLV